MDSRQWIKHIVHTQRTVQNQKHSLTRGKLLQKLEGIYSLYNLLSSEEKWGKHQTLYNQFITTNIYIHYILITYVIRRHSMTVIQLATRFATDSVNNKDDTYDMTERFI